MIFRRPVTSVKHDGHSAFILFAEEEGEEAAAEFIESLAVGNRGSSVRGVHGQTEDRIDLRFLDHARLSLR